MEIPQHRPPGREREMVFCHECENEWYRDEHGLTCPQCHSDFTEIIEEANDPRADLMLPDDESDEIHDGRPSNSSRGSPNPWASVPDPDEGNIGDFHWESSNGPGHITLHRTIYGNIGGRTIGGNRNQNNNPQEGVAQNFMTMLGSIIGAHRVGAMGGSQPGEQTDRPGHIRVIQGGGPNHTFTYTSTARLYPRDANNPARLEPLDDLNAILATMFGPPVHQVNQQDGQQHPPQLNPLAAILGSLLAPGAIHGDAVYSQEALDRVISRLMEQNASGNAPGPAATEDIASLPKRKVTIEDLGTDGKAECSICMDEVEVGDDVTVLPCTHWFHGQCVGMWLGEHDTCPHCRKGISDHSNGNNSSSNNNNNQTGSSNNTSANINTAPPNINNPNASVRSPSSQPPYPSPWASPDQHQPPPHSFPPSPAPQRPFPFASGIYNPVSPFDSSPSASTTGSAFGSPHPNIDVQVRQRPPPPPQGERRNGDSSNQGDANSGETIAGRIQRRLFGSGSGGGSRS